MDWNWIIAVVLAAAASFISNFGVTLQKLQHQRIAAAIARANHASTQHESNLNLSNGAIELARQDSELSDDLDDARQQHAIPINGNTNTNNNHSDDSTDTANNQAPNTAWHRKPLWRLGLALIVLGSIADFLALGFGPQSLIAPLGSLTLVSNAVYAPLILKEKISKWDWMSIGLIVFGSSLAVVFGAHADNVYTIDQLFSFFFRADFVLYWIVVALYIGIYRYYIFKVSSCCFCATHGLQTACRLTACTLITVLTYRLSSGKTRLAGKALPTPRSSPTTASATLPSAAPSALRASCLPSASWS